MIRNRRNTFIYCLLSIGMLFIGTQAYSITYLLARRTIGTVHVMNFGDRHAELGTCQRMYPLGAVQLNNVLAGWLLGRLKNDNSRTLFLLEWSQDGSAPVIYENDTIPSLKKLFSLRMLEGGKLEFRCADCRTRALKSFGTEFWYPFANINRFFSDPGSIGWNGFDLATYQRRMTMIYGPDALKILNDVTAAQFLADMEQILREIDVARHSPNFPPGSKQHEILSGYLATISESCNALRGFFTEYLGGDLSKPYYHAFVNSIEKNKSPDEVNGFCERYLSPQKRFAVADARLFIDVVNAINVGQYGRVVTYFGNAHMLELEKNLFEVYSIEPTWLGVGMSEEAKSYYRGAGIMKLISEMRGDNDPSAPEIFIGNISKESLEGALQ